MRVLVIADRLSDRGGADWHLLGVVRALAEQHQICLAVGQVQLADALPCPVHRIDGLAARVARPVAGLDELVRGFAPDVVHLQNVVNPVALRWAAARPAVLTVQDHRLFCPGRGKWTLDGRRCDRPMAPDVCMTCFEDADYFEHILALTRTRLDALVQATHLRLVVLSHYMKRELMAVGLDAARIEVIPPFVHGLDAGTAPEGPPSVLFVGRLVAAKGVDDAIAAWQRSGLELPLIFAGTGPERGRLQRAGHQVLGWVSHQRLAGLYRAAQVVLLPSRWQEPFGIVGVEALTLGTPVAAWDCGGVSEWHPGPGLARWGDVDGLAHAAARIAGTRARAPDGLQRSVLMHQLEACYQRAMDEARVVAAAPVRGVVDSGGVCRCNRMPGVDP